MTVNPDVDGYTKTQNHQQILQKTQKNTENQKNTKTEVYAKWGPEFYIHCSWQEGRIRHSSSSR